MILKKHEQVAEIVRCGADPVYFVQTYARIQHPLRGIIPFETYDFQDDCLKDFEKHRLNIVLKSRQLGLSTICAAYAAWMSIFYKGKNVLVIATKLSTAINFINKVKVLLSNLPKWLLLPKFSASQQSIKFSNGSEIKAIPTSDDAGRSEALSLLIVDEAAFIRNFEGIWTGLSPTISTGGRAIIISTPNGVGGQYYRLWTDAVAGVNQFNTIKLPWDVHPEHDEQWFVNESKNLPRRRIAQEFLCDFTASGDTFLQPDDLAALKTQIQSPVTKEGHDRNVWVWDVPIPGHKYIISADVSRGDARDYSAFHIIDVEECNVVVEYMGKVPPEKLAEMIEEWGKKYNSALACPEHNSFGYFVCAKLKANNYPHIYYESCRGDPFLYTPVNKEEKAGFTTSQKSRVQILTKLEELIRNKQLTIRSQRSFDQLQAFIWNGSKPMASKDAFDDLIMSLAIGTWLTEGKTGISSQDLAMAEAILRATSVNRRQTNEMPGSIQTSAQMVVPTMSNYNPRDSLKPREHQHVKHVDVTDFSWLMR
jgi:hypothetical protein